MVDTGIHKKLETTPKTGKKKPNQAYIIKKMSEKENFTESKIKHFDDNDYNFSIVKNHHPPKSQKRNEQQHKSNKI